MMKFPGASHIEAAIYFRNDIREKRSTFVIITNDMKAHQDNVLSYSLGPNLSLASILSQFC